MANKYGCRCGAIVDEGAVACPTCGTPVQETKNSSIPIVDIVIFLVTAGVTRFAATALMKLAGPADIEMLKGPNLELILWVFGAVVGYVAVAIRSHFAKAKQKPGRPIEPSGPERAR